MQGPRALPVKVRVETTPPYDVHIGMGALALAAAAAPTDEGRAILTDENVARLYLDRIRGLEDAPVLAVPPGESSKSLERLEQVLDFLAEVGLDRRSTLFAVGGGVVGDLGGLAAALYMRGISVVQCPTTLLAQVDASIGGKTAVNLSRGRNLAGTLHQPRAVFADTETLATLPDVELRSGLGEVAKCALIAGGGLLELVESSAESLLARKPEPLADVAVRCVRLKAGVVARDEREGGERKVLNLGHTFAHAIEGSAGYGVIPHGIAVAVGLVLALSCSRDIGLLEDRSLPDRIARLLAQWGLPQSLHELRARYGLELSAKAIAGAMLRDKKSQRGEVLFVLPRRAGDLAVDLRIDGDRIARILGA